MKVIFTHYKGLMFASIGALGCITFFFSVHWNNQLKVEAESTLEIGEDREYYNRDLPNIVQKIRTETILIGEPVDLTQLFETVDASGNEIPCYILSIKRDGEEVLMLENAEGIKESEQDYRTFIFDVPGIYSVQVYACDSVGLSTKRWCDITVNRQAKSKKEDK